MAIVSLKMLLISTALFVKLCVPVLAEIPSIWTSFISRLTPPYLYLLINFIIITILASSKIQHNNPQLPPNNISSHSTHFLNDYAPVLDQQSTTTLLSEMDKNNNKEDNDSLILPPAISTPIQTLSSIDNDKPPLSSRIRQRKLLKPSPEGKALGVSKPRKQETLESTWRTITEGRSMPLTRHLRKCDTWDSHARRANVAVDPTTPPSKVMKKSAAFAGGGSPSPSPGGGTSGRLKREASLTQDELNRRVEAFINKFNHDMRLQRQESFKQYQDMMGRPSH